MLKYKSAWILLMNIKITFKMSSTTFANRQATVLNSLCVMIKIFGGGGKEEELGFLELFFCILQNLGIFQPKYLRLQSYVHLIYSYI